jgi:hypothetical protein
MPLRFISGTLLLLLLLLLLLPACNAVAPPDRFTRSGGCPRTAQRIEFAAAAALQATTLLRFISGTLPTPPCCSCCTLYLSLRRMHAAASRSNSGGGDCLSRFISGTLQFAEFSDWSQTFKVTPAEMSTRILTHLT